MFLDFYKMKYQPFGVTPDPRFLYLGRSHREALASLYYAVESDRGFVAMIGPPGLGKTTLVFQLLEKLQQASRTVFLFQTQCNSKELIHYLLNALGIDAEGMELVSMHNKLNEILCREMLAGRRFVLAIDEAQNLDWEVLETIRLLSNFETSETKLLQILLIGQPQLARKLASPELEQLQQRISVFASLQPLDSDDIAKYIAHRLKVAGYEGAALFTAGALRILAEQSQGIPRRINSLCFSALSLGYATGRNAIDVATMQEVIADRDVKSLQGPSNAPRIAPAPTMSRPTLTGFSLEDQRNFGRWTLGAAGALACLALGIGIFSFSFSRAHLSLPEPSKVWSSIRGSLPIKDASAPHSSEPMAQAAEVSNSAAGEISVSRDNVEINSVIAQPGDTMRKIILRTLGGYNDVTIQQVHRLNPEFMDFDDLKAGQTIRLPLPLAPLTSTMNGEEAGATRRN